MKKILIIIFIAVSVTAFSQNNFYFYNCSMSTTMPADAPNFINADSILNKNHFQTSFHEYKAIDARVANFDMEVLGELHGEYFVKDLDHTFIRDVNILLPGDDTVLLKQRAFVYKDTAEASKVFRHISEKIVSAISVPNYRIIYKQGKMIYIISVKSYIKREKLWMPFMIDPIYDALAVDKKNTYVMFRHDWRIKKSR